MHTSSKILHGLTLLEITFVLAITSILTLLAGSEVRAFVHHQEEKAAVDAYYSYLWEARDLAIDRLQTVTLTIDDGALHITASDEELRSYPIVSPVSSAAFLTESGALSFRRDGSTQETGPVDLELTLSQGRKFRYRVYPAIGTIRRIS